MIKTKQYVILNKDGIELFKHFSDLYLRGNALDCHEISANHAVYLNIKVVLQRDIPEEFLESTLLHLLLPHRFVDLVCLNEPHIQPGFDLA